MIEVVAWDSAFFGFGVGKTELAAAVQAGTENLHRQMKEMGLQLLYVFQNEKDVLPKKKTKHFLSSDRVKQVDRKVTFGKSLVNVQKLQRPPGHVIPFTGSKPAQQLYSLALQSGEYSRFRLDKGFPPGTFERLYRLWIENSLNGSIADKVLIATDAQGNILGMVTLSLKGGQASIGLIAVDEKARGLKIGKILMQSAEWYAREAGKESIIVPTQMDNKAACDFYRHLGYEVLEVVRVWHVWGV